jgi:CheY-like chemotaxis protein
MTGQNQDAGTFQEFEQQISDVLAHLYDPGYVPHPMVGATLGCAPQQGVEAIQTALIGEIKALKPAPDVPPSARVRRVYDVLTFRYVHCLTQEKAAECLGITARHVRREQRDAVHLLAQRLWKRSCTQVWSADSREQSEVLAPSELSSSGVTLPGHRAQVREELASLQKSAPGMAANVEEAVRGAVASGRALTSRHHVNLEVGLVQPNLSAEIHPSALRQVLITAISKLVERMSSGCIALRAEKRAGCVRVAIEGCPATSARPLDSDLVQEVLAAYGGTVAIERDDDCICLWLELPALDSVTVMVVDDNPDIVHFFRRYLTGTRYEIVHVAQGQKVFDSIAASAPDIIVLDVMLPDADGWELLGQLRLHPATQAIPVVVCSVVRQEELALALGAAHYLTKPVRRQQLIMALDQVLRRA